MRRRVLLIQLATAALLGLPAGCLPGQVVQNPDSLPAAGPVIPNRPAPPVGPADASLPQGATESPGRPSPYQIFPNPPENRQATLNVAAAQDPVNPPDPPGALPQSGEPPIIQAAAANPSQPIVPALAQQTPADSGLLAALKALLKNLPEEEARRYLDKVQAGNLSLLLQVLLSDQSTADRLTEKEAAALLHQVDALAAVLRKRAPLQLPRICFCRKIKAFGVYDPLPDNPVFEAGENGLPGERVLVYVEVRNFATCNLDGKVFRTVLTPRLKIYPCELWRRHANRGEEQTDSEAATQDLEPVAPVEMNCLARRIEDSSRPLTDFFLRLEFNIPANLPRYREYVLRVEVRDEVGLDAATGKPRVARGSATFRVVPPSRRTQLPESPLRKPDQ